MTKGRPVVDSRREVEVKLALPAEEVERVVTAPVLAGRALRPIRRRRLVTAYFDTREGALCRHGWALRIRRVGGRRIQTLKGPTRGTGAAADRVELEVPIRGDAPDLGAFPSRAAAELAGLAPPAELVPVFTTRIDRTELEVGWPSVEQCEAVVLVAFDRGRIEVDGRHEEIHELELELERGPERALFALVDELRPLAPLSIETRDKAARGFALALGMAPEPRKAARLALAPTDTVAQGFRRIGLACLGHALANLAPAADGRDPEGVHQLRVALRRLRSALSLFRPALPEADRVRLNDELRWLLGELGPARDRDVLADELLPAIEEIEGLAPEREALVGLLAEGRPALYARVRDALESRRAADLWLDLAVWLELERFRETAGEDARLLLDGPLRPFAAERLDRRWRRVKKLARRFDRLEAEGRHELRIALKKLRYGVEFLSSLWAERAVRELADEAAGLQDRLGHLNDVAVALGLARELLTTTEGDARRASAALALGSVIGWHARGGRRMLREARERLDELLEAEPFWREAA
jgi:inorganic triphosphatase YgiF